MFKNKLTLRTLVLFTLLIFAGAELFPAVMVCAMGSSCKMMLKTPKCHASKKSDEASVSSLFGCCAKITSEKKSTEKEIFPQTQITGLAVQVPTAINQVFHSELISYELLTPDFSPPPLFLLKQSILI